MGYADIDERARAYESRIKAELSSLPVSNIYVSCRPETHDLDDVIEAIGGLKARFGLLFPTSVVKHVEGYIGFPVRDSYWHFSAELEEDDDGSFLRNVGKLERDVDDFPALIFDLNPTG